MTAPVRRTYADASVFGGVFDDEFAEDSQTFFEQAAAGRFIIILTSGLVADEVARAPAQVRGLFERNLPRAEVVQVGQAALTLQAAYLAEDILTAKSSDDALHVALATVARADLIVSWNFRHIVHLDKIPRYNAVNVLHGYREVAIHSPSEVIVYEDGQEV